MNVKGDSVGRAHRRYGVDQDGKRHLSAAAGHAAHPKPFVCDDRPSLRTVAFKLLNPFAQLRDLVTSDQSATADVELQDHGFLAAKVAEAVLLTLPVREHEIGCPMTQPGGVHV